MTRSRPGLVVALLATLFVVVLAITYVVVRDTVASGPESPSGAAPPATTIAPFPSPASSAGSSVAPSAEPVDPSAGDAAPADGQEPASKTEQAQWDPVAVGFAKALTTDVDDPAAWRAGLARYATPALQQQLATVDPRRLPGGRYSDREVIQYDDTTAVVVVTYSKDWTVAITVISDGENWKVYQYDRWEG